MAPLNGAPGSEAYRELNLKKMVEKSQKIAKLLKKTRIFASRAVNVAKLSHISATIWRPLCAAPPGVAGAPGAPLRHCVKDGKDTLWKLDVGLQTKTSIMLNSSIIYVGRGSLGARKTTFNSA